MNVRALVPLLLVLPLAFPGAGGTFHETLGLVPDREFVLVMQGTSFNGLKAPSAPLLEAYLGETVRFTVTVPPLAEAHTFHLHGHPWFVPDEGRVFDTWLHRPGDTHAFTVPAGGVDGHAGDWMYHCHVDTHTALGMWGIFRVYPFKPELVVDGAHLTVTLTRLGQPVEGASLALTLDGAPVHALVSESGDGRYEAHADALAGATGQLVLTATHPSWGESVARLALGGAAPEAPVVVAHAH